MTAPPGLPDPAEVETVRDPATGMYYLAMREWPQDLGEIPQEMIVAAEKRERRLWKDERKRGPKTPRPAHPDRSRE